jgi:hypothetical protein
MSDYRLLGASGLKSVKRFKSYDNLKFVKWPLIFYNGGPKFLFIHSILWVKFIQFWCRFQFSHWNHGKK